MKKMERKTVSEIMLTLLLLTITLQLIPIGPVYAQPIPIGTSSQTNPFEANPTVGTTFGIGAPTGTEYMARDGDLASYISWYIGATTNGYLQLKTFTTTSTPFTIGWVDFKISYQAIATIDDKYRIVYYVDPSPTAVVLQDWVSGASAKFDPSAGNQAHRPWHNQPEPNDGVWCWTDISKIRVRIETAAVAANDLKKIFIYEVWVTVYQGTLPPGALGNVVFSVQPPQVLGLGAGNTFFVDVFVGGADKMWGYEIRINYDTSVLTALDYFSCNPFNYLAFSEINDTAGYAHIAFGTYMGDTIGFAGRSPMVRIYFVVDSDGMSTLHFTKAIGVDVFGNPITLSTQDGFFSSVPTIYIRADGSVDPPTASILRNGDLYTLTDNIYTSVDGIVIQRSNMTLDGAGYVIQGPGSGNTFGIGLGGNHNVTIKNTGIQGFYNGVVCNVTQNIAISGNGLTHNTYGLYLNWSPNNTITGNLIINNYYDSILLWYSSNNTISGNLITDNGEGVFLWGSSDNSISGNNIRTSNYSGVVLVSSSNYNNIIGNSIISNHYTGIGFNGTSNSYNNIIGNNLTGNQYGMWFYSSSNNSIWHNNFENNTYQVYNTPFGNASVNDWNDSYPSGGNYWSDYSGVDLKSGPSQNLLGKDGIGDTPYVIDVNNKDNYPLMHSLAYAYTPVGENVTAPLTQDVNITFDQVNSEGITSLNRTATGPALPSGFELEGQYYDIKTNATYSGEITVKITYDDSGMTQLAEESLRLNQWDATLQRWVDITTSVDTLNNVIYGMTTHLSIFGVRSIIPVPQEIAVVNTACPKTVVCQGYNSTINVTVMNQGSSPKTFDVFVYANSTVIGSQTISNLPPSQQTTLTFTWDTTDFAKGNYTLSAYDQSIRWIIVSMVGDITGLKPGVPDGKVEIRDVALVCKYFGQRVPPAPPNCDIDNNGKVEIKDIALVCKNFGKTDP